MRRLAVRNAKRTGFERMEGFGFCAYRKRVKGGLVRRLAGRNASRSWESPQGAASVDAALRHAVRSNPSTQQAWREAAGGGGGQNSASNPALGAAAFYPQPSYPQSWVPGAPPGAPGFLPGGVAGYGNPAMPPGAGSGGSRSASRSSSGGPHGLGPPSRASSGGLPNDVGRNGSGFSAGHSGNGFSGSHLPRGAGAGSLPASARTATHCSLLVRGARSRAVPRKVGCTDAASVRGACRAPHGCVKLHGRVHTPLTGGAAALHHNTRVSASSSADMAHQGAA